MTAATWTLLTPPHAAGAIAMIQVDGEVDAALSACSIGPVPVGGLAFRNFFGIDEGVVARCSSGSVLLMPHGGLAVVRAIESALLRAGIPRAAGADARSLYPEARSDIEAHALNALRRAASPRAVDLLLAQHDRWAAGGEPDPAMDAALNRLIDPPLVVALGRPNIGKSALVNALARREVSIVADEEGTTRDHVGVRLTLDGLTISYLDTPGLRDVPAADPHNIESRAAALALHAATRADLLLICGDAGRATPPIPHGLTSIPRLTLALRADLGTPEWPADLSVSALHGAGLLELATLIRRTLVPDAVLAFPGPWRFCDAVQP